MIGRRTRLGAATVVLALLAAVPAVAADDRNSRQPPSPARMAR